ncbi:MAG: hypothetical protein methR_P1104 [Methyloprofundus sp.]|nr:MAG: hypothetical protein methR_P1104 [Methyloprofundus sp.]
MTNHSKLARWGIFPLWFLLTLSVFFRTPTPIDETRYLSVAWEMWLHQDFLVPYLNGVTYSHKPPLLFWLIQLSWGLLGVNEWAARLIGPLCALLNLYLIRSLARKLWPEDPGVALVAPWVLSATLLWTLFATATMFDILLTCCVLLGVLGLVNAAQGQKLSGWGSFTLAIGLGVLAKGPVILVHLMPVALLMPLWSPKNRAVNYYQWYGFVFLALIGGALIALAWAIPAAMHGGEAYGKAILWSQTANRAVTTHIHARPFWWYLPFLPLFIFPWVAWPRFWKSVRHLPWKSDAGIRLCTVWFLSCLLVFSLIQSKQVHYLVPLLPAFSLLLSRLMVSTESQQRLRYEWVLPICFTMIGLFLMCMPYISTFAKLAWVQAMDFTWGVSVLFIGVILFTLTLYLRRLSILAVSTSVVLAIFIGFICFFQYTGLAYNLKPAAEKVKYFQTHNIPVAYVGNYQGQFQFLGRLTQAIEVIPPEESLNWATAHLAGYLIYLEKKADNNVSYSQRQRERWLIFRTAEQVRGS